MGEAATTTNFIERVRTRSQFTADAQKQAEATGRPLISVTITRDGSTVEDLFFDHAPTLNEIAARAGIGAYVLAIDIQEKLIPVAAE